MEGPLVLGLTGLSMLIGLGALGCYIYAVVKMFQNQDTTYAILSIVLILCGIGPLVALVRAYQMRDEWDIRPVVNAWLAIIVVNIVLAVVRVLLVGSAISTPSPAP